MIWVMSNTAALPGAMMSDMCMWQDGHHVADDAAAILLGGFIEASNSPERPCCSPLAVDDRGQCHSSGPAHQLRSHHNRHAPGA